jgi:HSP20 family protein
MGALPGPRPDPGRDEPPLQLEREDKRENYHRVERQYGTFTRAFSLPGTVDAERIRAESKNGVLTIALPKKAEAKPRAIQVKVS